MKVGLALGSGASRGWAHIGILNALSRYGVEPDIVCGASIGALVGAAYVSGNLEKLESWVRSLTKFETVRFYEIHPSLNGFVNTRRLHRFLNRYVVNTDLKIEDFTQQYAAVATDLEAGREVWLTRGSIFNAAWSSMALPGMFPAVRNNDHWLIDGGLVNPVPVSICRALGAEVVIAVNLNDDLMRKNKHKSKHVTRQKTGVIHKITDIVGEYVPSIFTEKSGEQPPGLFETIADAINITQNRVTRSRMAGDPPDIVLSPKISRIRPLEFYRAKEAIEEGNKCVQQRLADIRYVLGLSE